MRYLKGKTYKIKYWDITAFSGYDYDPKQAIEAQCGVYTEVGEVIANTKTFVVLCTDKDVSAKIDGHPYRGVTIIPKGCIVDSEPE